MAKLYGIGVGPGDPELMTIKAVKRLHSCDVIGIPAKDAVSCTAFKIAVQAVPEIAEKKIVAVYVPMTKDAAMLKEAYDAGSRKVIEALASGHDVAFLNLGDPTIYGTYMEVHERVRNAGFETEIISGIPSFCAVSAKLQTAIAAGREQIHILPGCYLEDENLLEGTTILMKSGGKLSDVKQVLVDYEKKGMTKSMAVSACGMEQEQVFQNIQELDVAAGYFTTILVKKK